MDKLSYYRNLGNAELLNELKALVARERRLSTDLLACLSEVDRRRAHDDAGYPSMFAYCIRELRYGEGAAVRRIYSARAARKFPEIFSYLADGSLSMSAVALLSPHLTKENGQRLLAQAQGKSKRDLEWMIAGLAPQADKADRVKSASLLATEPHLPDTELPLAPDSRAPAGAPAAPSGSEAPTNQPPASRPPVSPEKIKPLSPRRVHFSFTASENFLKDVERARQVLWHKYPAGKLEDVFRDALSASLDKKDPDRRIARKLRRLEARFARPPAWARRR